MGANKRFKNLKSGDWVYFLDPQSRTVKHLVVKEVDELPHIVKITYFKISSDFTKVYQSEDDIPTGTLLFDPNLSFTLAGNARTMLTAYSTSEKTLKKWVGKI